MSAIATCADRFSEQFAGAPLSGAKCVRKRRIDGWFYTNFRPRIADTPPAKSVVGQAKLHYGRGDAELATQCDLESAAKRHPVKGGDDRLGACLDRVDKLRQIRGGERLAVLADVGAAREELAVAADDSRLYRGFVLRVGDLPLASP